MTIFIKKTINNFIKITMLFFLAIAGIFLYGNIVLTRAQDRSKINSVEAYISQKRLPVGVDGYGYLSTINVAIGDRVNTGDVLFTYFGFRYSNPNAGETVRTNDPESLFAGFQEIPVKALASGIVRHINLYQGSYITQDDIILELQSIETYVWSRLLVEPEDVHRIKKGDEVVHTLPDGTTINGRVKSIYPSYDRINKVLSVEATLDNVDQQTEERIIDGLPVSTTVFIEDQLGQTIESQITSLFNSATKVIGLEPN